MILLLTRQTWRPTHFQESTLKSICASAPILFYGVNMMSITTDKNRAKKQFFPLPTLAEYMIYFFLYSVLGWIYEVVLEVFIYRWGFSNRGALTGPYCVIYGFGALIFLILLKNLKTKRIGPGRLNLTPILVFFAIILIATTVELIGSYIMEWTQGGWMWDYSEYFCNFQGRIALNPSVRFGIGGMIILYLLQPLFERLTGRLSKKALCLTGGAIALLLLVDFLHMILT